MIYLTVFWILFGLFVVVFLTAKWFKIKRLRQMIEEYAMPYIIVLASLVIVAIKTNDPLAVAGIDLQPELQWIGSLLVLGFGSWKFYLNPLNQKVLRMDKELVRVNVRLDKLEDGFQILHSKIDKLTDHLLAKQG